MRKYLLALLAAAGIHSSAEAAVGDTTWVHANMDTLSWYGNYDSTVTFPAAGTSYRNVYMIVTVGKYVCPGSPTYCGDWDYTLLTYLMTPGGDTLELGRLITPYANSGAPRTPITWKHRYIYDVTDYASKLTGPATMRMLYSGYSGGFTGEIKFAFVEGTPDRDVKGMERLWHGSHNYGGATSINTKFPDRSSVSPSGTVSAELKFLITGHGSDDLGCCEFASHNYNVMLNGTTTETKAIWRDNCGVNDLYPQSGTWVYDRANWCPGAIVNTNTHLLPGVTAGSTNNVGIVFDPYTSPGGGLGSYTTEAHLVYYGNYNKTLDAAIQDIIAPTTNENHFRHNPICGSPVISVKNRGANAITAISFDYGIKDSVQQTHTWSGTLNVGEVKEIALPDLLNLETMAGTTGAAEFTVKITSVNGSADADASNDKMTTTFNPSPKWDGTFRVQMGTNNQTVTPGVSENSWKIYDQDNNVVRQRTGAAPSTVYIDTVTLPTGCYRLELTDAGCDGLQWWVYTNNPGIGVSQGSFFVKKMGSAANIPMNGYQYSGTYRHDFGCKFVQYFYTSTPVGVTDITAVDQAMQTYPNPATNMVNIDFDGMTDVNGTIQLIDALGRIVKTVPCTSAHTELSLNGLMTGIYTVVFTNNAGQKMQTRLFVTR